MDTAETELKVTERVLEMLLAEIAFHGIPDETPSGAIHECAGCGKRDVWGPAWRWYGSFMDAERGFPILKMCSTPCAKRVIELEINNAPKDANRGDPSPSGANGQRVKRRYFRRN